MELQSTFSSWAAGFTVCLALVASIGAQNLFVLRQALTGRHVSVCVAWCVLSDLTLMVAGVFGMARFLAMYPAWAKALTVGGAVFLLVYGLLACARLLMNRKPVQEVEGRLPPTRARVIAALAALTLLNPHVYLDTVLLVGSIGAREVGALKLAFVAGAASASLVWFLSLAFAGSRLQRLFARPQAWRVLDGLTGVTMLTLSWWVWSGSGAGGSL